MSNLNYKSSAKQWILFGLIVLLSSVAPGAVAAQSRARKISGGGKSIVKGKAAAGKTNNPKRKDADQIGDKIGVPSTGAIGVDRTTDEIMRAQADAPASFRPTVMPEREVEQLKERLQDPEAKATASYPFRKNARTPDGAAPLAPQPTGTSFTGATLAESGSFPADTMGAVGPTQFVVFINGRLRTFNKTNGTADGVINADPDVFFASVLTPNTPGGINFTSDPNVRFDRLTGRWFLTIIDIPSSSSTTIGDKPNRLLIAVSDAASSGVLSGSTVWTFYFVQQDTVGGIASTDEFLDYPSLGIDNNALYVGGNMFGATSGSFTRSSVFVIRKSSVLSGGPIVTTAFRDVLPNGTAEGPFAPRGVDNYDTAANEGYIIGASNAAFGRLVFRRISDPGGTPSITANILLTVPTTSFPITVDHLGDTGGTNGNLDALDDRLYAAYITGGRLWTSHNIAVLPTGVASGSNAQRRNGVRWYELNGIRSADNGGTAVVVQSGTIFDTAATVALARQYWLPTVMVSGQGHAAFGFSTAGTPFRIDAATNGRLSGDAPGTTGAVTAYTTAAAAYNPPSDPGPTRRWGDYSFTSLDPKDNMTMWTIQQFCNAANSYGVRAVKLIAPPPPAATAPSPANVPAGVASTDIVVTGTSSAGSGFYDPGANLPAPATPFNHISATGAGITVNGITYNSPTQVTINVSTVGSTPGAKTITITNPDGQTTTVSVNVQPGAPTAGEVIIGGRALTAGGRGIGNVVITLADENGAVRTTRTNAFGKYVFRDVSAGGTYVVSAKGKRFTFAQPSLVLNANEDAADINFVANP